MQSATSRRLASSRERGTALGRLQPIEAVSDEDEDGSQIFYAAETHLRRRNSGIMHDYQIKVSNLRNLVQAKRVQLHQQRAQYIHHRTYFQDQVANVLRAANAIWEPGRMPGPQRALHVQNGRLRGAVESFSHHEIQTQKRETELSNLEYWLKKEEDQLYLLLDNATEREALDFDDEYDDEDDWQSSTVRPTKSKTSEPIRASSESDSSESSDSSNHSSRLRKQKRDVEMLKERLDELDYDHSSDMDRRECNEIEGEVVDPPKHEFIEAYEIRRSSLMTQLCDAEEKLRSLQSAQQVVSRQSGKESSKPKNWEHLQDGVLRRFPGTFNAGHGHGLRDDRIGTGFMPLKERVESWRGRLPARTPEAPRAPGEQLTSVQSQKRKSPTVSSESGSSDSKEHRASSTASISSNPNAPKPPTQFSIWYGDKPNWRYSTPNIIVEQPVIACELCGSRKP